MADRTDRQAPRGADTGSREAPRARRLARRVALWLGWALAGLALALVLAAGALVAWPGLARPALVRAARAAGVELVVGDMRLEFSPLRLEARDVFVDTAPQSTAQGRARVRLRLPRLVLQAASDAWPDGAWLAELELAGPRVEALLPGDGEEREPDRAREDEPLAWWRLLGALGRVRITDGRVRVTAPWGAAGVFDFGAVLEPAQDALRRDFRVGGRVSFDTAGDTAGYGPELSAQTLVSATGSVDATGAVRAALALDRGRLDSALAAGLFTAQAEAVLNGDVLDVAALDLRAGNWDLALPGGAHVAGLDASLNGSGSWNLARGTFGLRDVALDVGERLALAGEASGGPGGLGALRLQGRVADTALVLGDLRQLLPEDLREVTCAGALGFSGSLEDGRFSLDLDMDGLSLRWPRRGMSLAVSGTPSLGGGLNLIEAGSWSLGGWLELRGDADLGSAALAGARLRADLGGTVAAPELAPARLDLPAGGLLVSGEPLPLGALGLRATLRREVDGSLMAGGVQLDSARLGRFTGGLAWRPGGLAASAGRLRTAALGLPELAALLKDMGLLSGELPALSGTAAVEARLEPERGGRLTCEVALSGAGFSTEDGAWLADKGRGTLRLEAGLAAPGRVALHAALDQGEVLLGTVYLDLGATPLALDLEADSADGHSLSGVRGRLALGGLAEVALDRGRALRLPGGWSWAGAVDLVRSDVPGLLRTFLKDPLSFSQPELAALDVRGGLSLSLEAEAPGDGGVLVTGALGLDGVEADYPPAGLAVRGLDLDLPLAYRFGALPPAPKPAGADAPEPAPSGRLTVASLALPTGEARDLAAVVELFDHRLVLDGTLDVPLLSGTLSLSRLRVADPLSAGFRATLAARLRGADLSVLGTEQVPLEGSLEADFPLLDLTRERLVAEGGATGTLFGGAFTMAGFGATKPLARSRVAGCETVRLRGLDLERLSLALGIGRITGRLDADMDGLRLAYGQPQALAVELRSVPTDGVSQKVSLRAVNSISVVGTGTGLSGLGVGMFASFFKEFGYKALGIRCTLKNDVFSVRGLIREGGVEYLIKKPALFGINVVNGNPDNRIAFSDMVERVRRVLQSAPRAGAGSGD